MNGSGKHLVKYMREHPLRLTEAKREGWAWRRKAAPTEYRAQRIDAAMVRSMRCAAVRGSIDWALVTELRGAGLSWARVSHVLSVPRTTLFDWHRRGDPPDPLGYTIRHLARLS